MRHGRVQRARSGRRVRTGRSTIVYGHNLTIRTASWNPRGSTVRLQQRVQTQISNAQNDRCRSQDAFLTPMTVARCRPLRRLIYVNALFIVGTLGTLITPAVLESWARFHWSQSQLGLVATLELVALASGSLSGLYWQRRWHWRHVALVSLVLAIVANLACVIQHGFVIICIARGAAGLAGGLLCAIFSAFLANTQSPGKVIAVTNFIMIGIEALFVFWAATVFQRRFQWPLYLNDRAVVVLVPLLGYCRAAGRKATAATRQPSSFSKATRRIYARPGVCSLHYGANRRVPSWVIWPPSGAPSAEQSLRIIGISLVFSSLVRSRPTC